MRLYDDLATHGITLCGALPLGDCALLRPNLLLRAGFAPTEWEKLCVLIFAVPYLTPAADDPHRNLSSYAVSRDYHLYMRRLFEEWIPSWQKEFPDHRFVGFADHSPLDEVETAIRAGLGIRGRNGLLLTVRCSSYIFLGEIITDLPLISTHTPLPEASLHCHDCGACVKACPMTKEGGACRSALTQQKGELTAQEQQLLRGMNSVWGCDICQEVCPYTAAARQRGTLYTQIPFFYEHPLPQLTTTQLDDMSGEEFARRAYAWRGPAVIRRNLSLLSSSHKED